MVPEIDKVGLERTILIVPGTVWFSNPAAQSVVAGLNWIYCPSPDVKSEVTVVLLLPGIHVVPSERVVPTFQPAGTKYSYLVMLPKQLFTSG